MDANSLAQLIKDFRREFSSLSKRLDVLMAQRDDLETDLGVMRDRMAALARRLDTALEERLGDGDP